jgi:hypothetical protein
LFEIILHAVSEITKFRFSLLFLKVYATEAVLCSIASTTSKTYRKWTRNILNFIGAQVHYSVSRSLYAAALSSSSPHAVFTKIEWENRFRSDRKKICKVTVDGVDFPIQEPSPFSPKWFSHKFKGPGLRYEIAVCIQTGHIVWIHGPFPCGPWPDLKIFRSNLKNRLCPGEMVEANNGYRGEPRKVHTADDCRSRVDRRAKETARARHETVNKRFKRWGCLKQQFHHELCNHKTDFAAVAVCTQLSINNGEPLFAVIY